MSSSSETNDIFFDSSSSSSDFDYTGFLELSIPKNSSSSSSYGSLSEDEFELLTVVNKDPQNLTRIQVIDQQENLNTCYYFPFDEPCPERYYFQSFVDNCEVPPCDKICCPIVYDEYDAMICGRVYSGSMDYNTPWQFHLDPDSISIQIRRDVGDDATIGLSPSEIESLVLGGSVGDGEKFCFALKGAARPMEVVGVDYCEAPLELQATRVFDEQLGEYVQQTFCDGDCLEISGPFCLDGLGDQFVAEVDAEMALAEQVVAGMEPREYMEYYFNIVEGSEDSSNFLNYALDFESMEEAILSFSSSSTSFEDRGSFAVSFAYHFDPISTNPMEPFYLPLGVGSNEVLSKVGGADPENYFWFSVEPGQEVSDIYISLNVDSGSGVVGIQTGTAWGGQAAIEELAFSPDSTVPFSTSMPLGEGDYALRVQSSDPSFEYFLFVTVSPAGEP